jgi:hypothetical protein
VLVDVDHTADANFSLAEYPVITDNAGNPFDPASVMVEILPETDGHSFALRVTNVAWVNDLGYGGGDPDIILKWYRTGYAPVT